MIPGPWTHKSNDTTSFEDNGGISVCSGLYAAIIVTEQ